MGKKYYEQKSFIIFVLILSSALIYFSIFLSGCKQKEESFNSGNEAFVIQSGDIVISTFEFTQHLDLKKSAYPQIDKNYQEYNSIVVQLIDQLSNEVLLRRLAFEKGIIISDQELEETEKKIKQNYTDEDFESVLLKNTVSYSFWKNQLKIGLIMENVIKKELKDKIVITTKEIVEYYSQYKKENKNTKNKDLNEKDLLANLRKKKAEDEYLKWLDKLGKIYPVKINYKKLETFLIKPSVQKNKEAK